MNKIPYFKAKIKGGDRMVEGFYFAYPETTYCFTEDYDRSPVEIIHCIVTHRMTDWSLPNQAECYRVEPDTIAQIGWFDADRRVYGTEKWYEELESDQHPGEWHREVLGSTSGYGKTVMYQCSECGGMSISQYNYCPNCGKRMLEVMYYPQVDGITAVVVKTNGGMICR